jgi:putative FmdB family regulatory protein
VPTYQYACTTCGEQVEAVQRFSDDPLTVCPACGGSLRKVFSPVGIVFKGSGFYRTDSRKAAAKAEDSGAKAEDSGAKAAKSNGSSGSGEGSSEGKKDSASSDGKKTAAKASQSAGAKSGS